MVLIQKPKISLRRKSLIKVQEEVRELGVVSLL